MARSFFRNEWRFSLLSIEKQLLEALHTGFGRINRVVTA